MNNGFVKVAAATPKIKVGDCGYNGAQICKIIDEVYDNGAQLVVFPELCITGYTCSDLFWQKSMLDMAKTHLQFIAEHCEDKEIVAIVGLPMIYRSKLYNVAAVIYDGEILGLVPWSDESGSECRSSRSGSSPPESVSYSAAPFPSVPDFPSSCAQVRSAFSMISEYPHSYRESSYFRSHSGKIRDISAIKFSAASENPHPNTSDNRIR